jgi:MOSC domain-containing protein YiiM
MIVLEYVEVSLASGVAGDHRGKACERQVTVLEQEAWEATCFELGKSLPWTARRANLFIEGVPLRETRGKYLKIGDLFLEITGETKPCQRMDEFYSGLQEKLKVSWRGGVTCRVIRPGTIYLENEVNLTDDRD